MNHLDTVERKYGGSTTNKADTSHSVGFGGDLDSENKRENSKKSTFGTGIYTRVD